MDKSLYPPDWKQISERIRFERAGNRCEQCGIENSALIIRSDIDPAYFIVYDETTSGYRHMDGTPIRLSEMPEEYSGKDVRIVLTVAHLNHDPSDNRDENLKAMCQRCHLLHDKDQHKRSAAETRRRKKYQNQPSLF